MSIPVLSVKDDKGNIIPIPAIKGDKGDRGEKGERGEQGIKGDKGDKGDNADCDQSFNPKSQNAQSGFAVAEALSTVGSGKYTEIISTEVTQGDVDNAGEDGLIVVSFGNENVSFEPYNEILVCIDVPATSGVNPSTTQLYIAFSSGQSFTLSDENVFLRVQGAGAYGAMLENTACKMRVKGNFKEDTFLYGEIFKNGYGISYGYAGLTAGWTNIHNNFVKSRKKYVHITSTPKNYKFQAGTIIKVYGR